MPIEEKDLSKPFPVDGPLYDYSVDDLLYGWLYSDSEYDFDSQQYFITNSKRLALTRGFRASMGGMSPKTAERHFNLLKERNLIKYQEEKKRWLFNPQGLPNPYRLVNKGMLKILLTACAQNTLRIYVYLLNKFHFANSLKRQYIFTATEIGEKALGYTENYAKQGSAIETVDIILQMLYRSGIIKYGEILQSMKNTNLMTKRKILYFVAERSEQLPELDNIIPLKDIGQFNTVNKMDYDMVAEVEDQEAVMDYLSSAFEF